MKKSGIERLIDYILDNQKELFQEESIKKARLCILDELGCGIYGSTMPEAKKLIEGMNVCQGQKKGKVAVWGTDKSFSPEMAAFINGSLCHMRELDDVHFAILHTGAVCVPAALAVASVCEASLQELLKAVIVGVEVTVRIAEGMDFLNHRERGWHGTSTCGAFGAAAAAGVLLHLTREELIDALGIAGSRTGGTWAFAADGAMTKRLHPGMAARDGVLSAFLAQKGIKGPGYVLEAVDGGFYRLMSGSFQLERLDRKRIPAIQEVEYKWFASCKSVHSPFSAAARICREYPEKSPKDIEDIQVFVNQSAIEMAGGQYHIDSVVSAQISIPYGVALGLWGRSGRAEDYTEACLQDEDIRKTSALVKVRESEEMNRLRKQQNRSAAVVKVKWKDKTEASAFEKAPKGSMFAPLTKEDIIDKFYTLTRGCIGKEKADQVQRFLLEKDFNTSIEALIKMLEEV